MGYSPRELDGRDFLGDIHPEDQPALETLIQDVISGAASLIRADARLVRKDGDIVDGRLTGSVIRPPTGERYLATFIEDTSAAERGDIHLVAPGAEHAADYLTHFLGVIDHQDPRGTWALAQCASPSGGRLPVIYAAGNAGNGGTPQPDGVILGAGAQFIRPSFLPQAAQNPGQPTPLGSFSVTQLGDKPDKVGKDDNFRGLTVYDNVVYYTKGSGGNGVNTVYFLDTTGKACPSGTGLPVPGAKLPTSPLAYDPATLQSDGLPSNMCILQGFPTALKSTTSFPFGLWFASPATLYVADEGSGDNTYSPATGTYTTAAGQAAAGLQKWVLSGGSWKLAYTLQGGLALGTPYTVPGYPTGDNAATGLPWAPATDGLRNITGQVNRDGSVTIWAITSTVSGAGDQGADPNKLVSITDRLGAAAPAAGESFRTVRPAGFGQVLRGVSFTPGTRTTPVQR